MGGGFVTHAIKGDASPPLLLAPKVVGVRIKPFPRKLTKTPPTCRMASSESGENLSSNWIQTVQSLIEWTADHEAPKDAACRIVLITVTRLCGFIAVEMPPFENRANIQEHFTTLGDAALHRTLFFVKIGSNIRDCYGYPVNVLCTYIDGLDFRTLFQKERRKLLASFKRAREAYIVSTLCAAPLHSLVARVSSRALRYSKRDLGVWQRKRRKILVVSVPRSLESEATSLYWRSNSEMISPTAIRALCAGNEVPKLAELVIKLNKRTAYQACFALFVFHPPYGVENDIIRVVNLTKACTACKKKTILLHRCGACFSTWYCSHRCAKIDWKAGHHKEACCAEAEEAE